MTPEHGADGLFAADNSTVYVWSAEFESGGLVHSVLSALRVSDGSEKWDYDVPARVGSVSVAGSVVWLTSSSIFSQGQFSSLIALHRPDGAVLERMRLRRQHLPRHRPCAGHRGRRRQGGAQPGRDRRQSRAAQGARLRARRGPAQAHHRGAATRSGRVASTRTS